MSSGRPRASLLPWGAMVTRFFSLGVGVVVKGSLLASFVTRKSVGSRPRDRLHGAICLDACFLGPVL